MDEENDVDGYSYRTKRVSLVEQLKLKPFIPTAGRDERFALVAVGWDEIKLQDQDSVRV